MFGYRGAFLLVLIIAVGAIIWPGCSDDKGTGSGARPAIDNIWPNEDGSFWTYGVTLNIWDDWDSPCDTPFDCDDDPPPLPSWNRIEALLDDHDIPDGMATTYASYGLTFAGDTISMSGVTGQNLRASLDLPGSRVAHATGGCGISAFIARLYMARPDLRTAIEDRFNLDPAGNPGSGDTDCATLLMACTAPECPLLIHGYVWEKTEDWIGTYGDVDTLLAWKFLEEDLSAGHEFTHQLVPSLADDVFLHCKVRGRAKVTTAYQAFRNGLDCLYIIDYGSWISTGPGGEEVGCCRTIDYGRVVYVPEVGPVFSYERILVGLGARVGTGVGERILSLTDTGLPSE